MTYKNYTIIKINQKENENFIEVELDSEVEFKNEKKNQVNLVNEEFFKKLKENDQIEVNLEKVKELSSKTTLSKRELILIPNDDELLQKYIRWFEEKRKTFIFRDQKDKSRNERGSIKNKEFKEFKDLYEWLRIGKTRKKGYGIFYVGEDKEFSYNDSCVLKVPYHMFLSFNSIVMRDIDKKDGFIFWINFDSSETNKIFFESYRKAWKGKEAIRELENHEVEESFLTLFLALCRKNKGFNHYWKPYTDFLCALPEQGDYKSFKREFLENVLPLIEGWYIQSEESITDYLEEPNLDNFNDPNNETYRWAYSIVKTRGSKPVDEENKEKKILTNTYLIPMVELFNTKSKKNPNEELKLFNIAYLHSENFVREKELNKHDSIVIKVETDKVIKVESGKQIFIDYGENSQYYGINENPETQIQIPPK
ncbi:MAG: hypothetical protein MRERC_4c124 [Mycoplasmataceae bacterium RC_NB112A]|nr:MAG: hypothetical protein MRERC_6c058 [Mycoplasmataceae bacterium RC_NB112A]KLL02158.1 MAG: hypothetical protein MRERC_4c124 [Mycoplasmataceae bacterium RC_NB112A]